jgi:hypothetical protein
MASNTHGRGGTEQRDDAMDVSDSGSRAISVGGGGQDKADPAKIQDMACSCRQRPGRCCVDSNRTNGQLAVGPGFRSDGYDGSAKC